MTGDNIIRATSSEPKMSEYLNRRGIALGLPVTGTFELTARCNFNCRMCYVHQKNTPKMKARELSAEQWLSIAEEAKKSGLIFLLLTGGEPFIREDFPYLYTELVKMGILVSINSNASLYNPEIRALFQKYPPSRINVTLYGGSEETYKRLCGNASFEKVVQNLKSMKEDNLQIRLNVSLTPDNVCDMDKIDRISREIGLQAKAASYMYPPVRISGIPGENQARFSAEEAGEVLAKWNAKRDTREMYLERAKRLRAFEEAGIRESCSDVEQKEQEGVRCRAGRSSFWMTWDGRLLPCGTMDVEASYPLRDGFEKAWQEVRERTAAIRLPKECSGCANRNNCGVCASICKGETGCFDGKPEYMCIMMQTLREKTIEIADEMEKEGDKQ